MHVCIANFCSLKLSSHCTGLCLNEATGSHSDGLIVEDTNNASFDGTRHRVTPSPISLSAASTTSDCKFDLYSKSSSSLDDNKFDNCAGGISVIGISS